MLQTGGIWQNYHVPRERKAVRVRTAPIWVFGNIVGTPLDFGLLSVALAAGRCRCSSEQQKRVEETVPNATTAHATTSSCVALNEPAGTRREKKWTWLKRGRCVRGRRSLSRSLRFRLRIGLVRIFSRLRAYPVPNHDAACRFSVFSGMHSHSQHMPLCPQYSPRAS